MQAPTFYQMNSTFWQCCVTALTAMAFVAGLGMSLLSLWEMCTSACAAGLQYRIFGMHFAPIGIAFFALAGLAWLMSLKEPLHLFTAAALGAETYFVYLQKFVIGQWCPLCLGIFACVATLAVIFSVDTLKNRSETMRNLGALILGFFIVFFGVTKEQSVYADVVGEKTLFFGNKSSPVDVYVFTDWFCPACRKAEAFIERKAPEVAKKARLFFIDVSVHEDSMNFLPYNLSFIVNEKAKYLKLRQKLAQLALNDKTPNDEQVEQIAKSLGTSYKQLNYAEISLGTKFFEEMTAKYGIDSTPTVVIVNPSTKKMTRLVGVKEIKKANFLALIEAASKPK
jgi:uncharacterized membrane protein